MPQKANTPITCQVCGTTKLVTLQRAERQKFCSAVCQGEARRGKFFGTRATANRVCQICDRPFHAKQVHINAGIAKYCSGTCRGASQQIPLKIPDATEDLIYMAGIIDGEGTITICSARVPRIMMANSSMILMDWVEQTFGGRVSSDRKTRSPKHKPVACWYMGSSQSIALCRLLLPYLKVKHRHAEIVSEWRSVTTGQREILLTELRALNKRGL